jgi:Terminase large subunit, ATPase domain
MIKLPINIIEFARHPDLLNDTCHSASQKVCLTSIYGLPLRPDELQIYQRGTGRPIYNAAEQREITIIAGRRSGKTGKLAAPICCFEAFRDHGLPPGEEAHVMLLAPTLKQARIAFRYIRDYLRNSPVLTKRIVRITKEEIVLDNGVVIGCYPCTYDGVRGRTIIAVICDELAFWSDEEDSANPAEEVIAALRPGMATVRNPKLVKISTPFGKTGLLWREFQQRSELDYPVWRLSTQEMNPTIDTSFLEHERRRNEEEFCREYLGEFTDSINGWITPEILDPCIIRGRQQLPSMPKVRYMAALDPASRHDDFALAILHESAEGKIAVDKITRWTGTKSAPLVFEFVLGEVRDILSLYGLNSAIGDQFYFDVLNQYFLKLGIYYESRVFSANTRATIFGNMKQLLLSQKIELLDDPELIRQFRRLREQKTARGQIDVRPIGGALDDLAVAVALAARELTIQEPLLPPIQPGIVERYSSRLPQLIPGICPVEAICRNFPRCLDEGACQGFDRE